MTVEVIIEMSMSLDGYIAGPNELRIDVVPVLLGGGIRLFDELHAAPIMLEQVQVTPFKDFTHI